MIIVRNNFDFRAMTPVTIPAEIAGSIEHRSRDVTGAQPVPTQQIDDTLVLLADVPAGSEIACRPETEARPPGGISASVENGVVRVCAPSGDFVAELSLGLIDRPSGDAPEVRPDDLDDQAWPEMTVDARQHGAVCTRSRSSGRWADYEIDLTVCCYHAGFVDVEIGVTNQGSQQTQRTMAIAKRVRVDRGITSTASRLYGRVRQELQFEEPPDRLYQGLDWLLLGGEDWTCQLMNDQTFNWHQPTPDGKWLLECNGRMAMHRLLPSDSDACCVTSLTGPRYTQTRYDADGQYEFVGPPPGRRISYAMRLHVSGRTTAAEADRQFVLYEGYRRIALEDRTPTVDLGVRHTKLGVLYIPDRLAEDFVLWRTDTSVGKTNDLLTLPRSRRLRDVIRRDFRIMSALGLACRYHHLKARNDVELEMVRFILETARTYGVSMCLDIDYEPGAIAAVDRLNHEFADVIEFNEPMNEAIYADHESGEYCQGVNAAYLDRAREMLAEFHKSSTRVIITVSKGMAAYAGIVRDAGLDFQCLSSHDYFSGFRRGWRPVEDQLDQTFEVANYPISLGNYCGRHGLEPMATESGWGGLTHLSDEDRVAVCREIYGRQLAERGITHLYKCWFQDTFWKRHGRRHYELVAWDRTLRGEGALLRDLQKQYGPRDLPINQVELTCAEGEITASAPFELSFTVRNISEHRLTITAINMEGPEEIAIAPDAFEGFVLEPRDGRTLTARLTLDDREKPGYYHVFPVVRYRDDREQRTICGWSVLRHRSFRPDMIDLDRSPYESVEYPGGVKILREIDLNAPTTIAVGANATRKEAEWAYNLHNVLHSVLANDELLIRWESYLDREPQMFERNLIVIGTPEHSMLARTYAPTVTGPKVMTAPHKTCEQASVLLLLGDSTDTHGWQQMEMARHDVIEEIDIVCADVLRRFVALSRYYLSPRIGIVEEFGGAGAVDTDKTLV
ncbi:MAG: hypothetical protein CMJ18_22625 [Phycisphaeraceae bacterium]|nr:hypothetical protein [Phycisphaeraceae bacterium]